MGPISGWRRGATLPRWHTRAWSTTSVRNYSRSNWGSDEWRGPGTWAVGQVAAGAPRWMSGRAIARYKTKPKTATGEDDGGGAVPEVEPAEAARLADVVGEGRTEGPGDDVGHPEGGDAVQAEPPPRQGGEQDEDAEEDARGQVTQVEGGRREVPERRPEGKGGEHGRPVERFASLGRDAVDGERALAALPEPEDGGQHHRPQQGRPRIGDVDVEMEEIGHARTEDGDGKSQEPVRQGPVPAGTELQHEPDDEQSTSMPPPRMLP